MGLETRRVKAATDDDRHGTSPKDHIIDFVQYKFQLSTANLCGSNIMQTWIISVLETVEERELQKC